MPYGNRFFVRPGGDFGPGLSGLAESIGQAGEIKREREEEEATQQMFAEAADVFRTGDLDKIMEFSIKNPQASETLNRAMKFRSERTKEDYINSIFDVLQDPSRAEEIVGKRQEFLRSQGVGPEGTAETDSFLEKFRSDPEGTKRQLEMELAFRAPEKYKQYRIARGESGEEATTNIKDFQHYQRLQRENPTAASEFAAQVGIAKTKPDDRTSAIKEFEYGEKNPQFLVKQKAKLDDKETKARTSKIFKNTSDLRKEFLSQSKEFQKVRDSYTRVQGSVETPSPAGDLSLIFNYMKMLDPGSVVRESEFRTAAAAGSYGQRMQAAVQKVFSGERLSDSMRNDFVSKAKVLFEGMRKQHTKREKNYSDIAVKNNLPIDQVVVDISESLEQPLETGQPIEEMTSDGIKREIQEELKKVLGKQ